MMVVLVVVVVWERMVVKVVVVGRGEGENGFGVRGRECGPRARTRQMKPEMDPPHETRNEAPE